MSMTFDGINPDQLGSVPDAASVTQNWNFYLRKNKQCPDMTPGQINVSKMFGTQV